MRLEDGAAVVVQQVDLVDDEQPHQLRVTRGRPLLRVMTSHFSGVVTMTCGRRDLGLGQAARRPSARAPGCPRARQALREVADDLLHQRLHGRDVHDLEGVQVHDGIGVVGRPGAGRADAGPARAGWPAGRRWSCPRPWARTAACSRRCRRAPLVQARLHAVELGHARRTRAAPTRAGRDGHERSPGPIGLGWGAARGSHRSHSCSF